MSATPNRPLSADEIRQSIIERARDFADRHRTSFSAISIAAINDSKFLRRVEQGEGFNVTTYQRVLDWMDAADMAPASVAADENAGVAAPCHANPASADLQGAAR